MIPTRSFDSPPTNFTVRPTKVPIVTERTNAVLTDPFSVGKWLKKSFQTYSAYDDLSNL